MSTQTVLNIVLSVITVYLAYRNYTMSNRKDVQRESQEMTEIRVQLTQVMELLHELQKDIRTSTQDYQALRDRVLIIEMRLDAAYARIEEMKGAINAGVTATGSSL